MVKFLAALEEEERQKKAQGTAAEESPKVPPKAPPAQEFAQAAREEALVQLRERSKDDSYRIRNLEVTLHCSVSDRSCCRHNDRICPPFHWAAYIHCGRA